MVDLVKQFIKHGRLEDETFRKLSLDLPPSINKGHLIIICRQRAVLLNHSSTFKRIEERKVEARLLLQNKADKK